MFSALAKPLAAYLAMTLLAVVGLLAGCQGADLTGEAAPGRTPAVQAANQDREPDSSPTPVQQDADETTLHIHESLVEDRTLPPQSVQDLVNRSHAVVIGSISAISEVRGELPYGTTAEDFQGEMYQGFQPHMEVAYYEIAIEEVLLDDGNIRSNPRLRLEPDPVLPQMGQRYLFTLGRNPDSKSYGIAANWMILTLGDGGFRNLDGSRAGYLSVANEASLIQAIKEAVPNHDFLPVNRWPDRFAANEGDSPATPAPPGGPGGGPAAPVGNTGGSSN